MAQRATDRFANLAHVQVVESAAGTATYQELLTGISLGQGIGILIDQIEYFLGSGTIELLLAAGDEVSMGWTTSNAAGSLGYDQRRTIHQANINAGTIVGTPASGAGIIAMPLVYQFFPPLIVAAPRIYLATLGISLASVVTVDSRLYFRYTSLSPQEYLELAETFQLVG